MASLKAFLNPRKRENKEVIVSDRFQEDGNPVPFIIRPVTQEENNQLIKKFTRKDKKGNEEFDRIAYNMNLVTSAVVFPDLDNAELQNAYGTLGASKLLSEMLYIGEFGTLLDEVQKLSGLDTEQEELIDEVKN